MIMPLTLMRWIVRLLIVTPLIPLLSSPVLAGDGTCTKNSRVCIEGPETRPISGYQITRSCWKYENSYNCSSQTSYVDDCSVLVAQGCGQIGSSCIDYMDSDPSKCSLYEQTYQCKIADGGTSTVMDCGGQVYCMDGNCTDASSPPDADFGMAVTSMEVLREAGVYLDENTLTLFQGKNNQCTVTLGVFNCCKTDTKGADMNNSSMTSSMVMSGAKSIGGEAVQYLGSTYMYDALFQSDAPNFLISGFESIYGSGSSSAFNPSVSYFGLTVGFGTPAAGSTLLLGQSGTFFVAFDPTSFVIAVVIYVIMELMSCNTDEQVLAMKRGQRLCAKVGSYCSIKVLGVCTQKKESYCCYNSRLARLIAVEGRAQLAKPWGAAKSPDCGGFTQAEIARIDFGKIDFSEVIAEVTANVKLPDFAIGRATTQINNYYSTP